MMDFKIENAKPEDVEAIRGIVKASWLKLYPNETYGIKLEDLSAIDWFNPESLEKRRKEITEHQDTVHVWVIRNGNKVIGFCKALKFNDSGEIDAMYVIPEFQGKGLGKKLMQKAFEWLGPVDIKLKVVKYNSNAIEFYKKMEFKETTNKVVYEETKPPGGIEIPRIEMVRKFEKTVA